MKKCQKSKNFQKCLYIFLIISHKNLVILCIFIPIHSNLFIVIFRSQFLILLSVSCIHQVLDCCMRFSADCHPYKSVALIYILQFFYQFPPIDWLFQDFDAVDASIKTNSASSLIESMKDELAVSSDASFCSDLESTSQSAEHLQPKRPPLALNPSQKDTAETVDLEGPKEAIFRFSSAEPTSFGINTDKSNHGTSWFLHLRCGLCLPARPTSF